MKKLFKENDLVKFVFIAILLTVVLTWIIPTGSFNGSSFTKADVVRTGISELSLSPVYAVSFFLQQIVFVLMLGAFYGVISKANGYRELVAKCAKFIKGKEVPAVLIVSALIALFVSLTSQVFISFIAIPFIITVLLNAKLDKKTAFIATFGSIFIGMIGATYGTEGLYFFNYYMNGDIKTGLKIRFAILALAYVLFNIFNISHIKKVVKSKNIDETEEDNFAVEKVSKKNTKVWPMAVLLFVVFAFAILGYVKWEEQFEITVFNKFHEWFTGVKVGDTAILSAIFGKVTAFGTWELYSILAVLLVISLLTAVIYKISVNEVIEGALNGVSKMAKPAFIMILAYSVFVLLYWSAIVPTIADKILPDKFNAIKTAIVAFISSFFTVDFGYTGYTIGQYLTAAYSNSMDKIFVIFPSMYGFVQMFAPTSVILVAGLSYTKINYIEWLKHIWKFLAAMIAILIIIFVI